MRNKYKALEEIIGIFKKQTPCSIRKCSKLLKHSPRTVYEMLNGVDHPVSYYVDFFSYLAYSSNWVIDVSEVSEMVERALHTDSILVVGAYNPVTRSLDEYRFVMMKDKS